MTEYLRRLADEHGNDWPQAALDRLLHLHWIGTRYSTGPGPEYNALLAWAKETIEAGVAFKQSAEEF